MVVAAAVDTGLSVEAILLITSEACGPASLNISVKAFIRFISPTPVPCSALLAAAASGVTVSLSLPVPLSLSNCSFRKSTSLPIPSAVGRILQIFCSITLSTLKAFRKSLTTGDFTKSSNVPASPTLPVPPK